jgi:hypothetical protein
MPTIGPLDAVAGNVHQRIGATARRVPAALPAVWRSGSRSSRTASPPSARRGDSRPDPTHPGANGPRIELAAQLPRRPISVHLDVPTESALLQLRLTAYDDSQP